MRIWYRRRRNKGAEDPRYVATECEAFLQGTYVEYLRSTGSIIPGWAWLNVLAHSTEGEIRCLSDSIAPLDDALAHEAQWQSLQCFLAGETLGLASATGRSVAEIQRSILVDVELALAREGERRQLTPSYVVGRTMAAIHGHRRDRC
jgi:hypothetical protein